MKRIISVLMVFIFVLIYAMSPVCEMRVYGAGVNIKYIKEFKLFVKTNGDLNDAKEWCDEQEENWDDDELNDWKVVEGNLNEDASGALKKEVGVFLCYTSTDNPDEAVTDIAVMNEQGNWSESAYERIIEEQKSMYMDMVTDMQSMLSEYRKNYYNDVPTAIKAYDLLNGYIEDDSGELLGDLLLDITDNDLTEMMLQANGQVVIFMQEQLSLACDTGNSTWLDRMEKIGSYKAFRKTYIKAYNNNTNKADKALKTKYHDKALALLDSWQDMKNHIQHCEDYAKRMGLEDMTDEEYEKWLSDHADDDEAIAYNQENRILNILAIYGYDDKSLIEFFDQDIEDVSGDNIKYLYPLASCLSDGQMASINETVNVFRLCENAVIESTYNNYEGGLENKVSDYVEVLEDTVEEDKKIIDEQIEEWKEGDPISVYEGVDRETFKGGVAVTSNAESYSNGSQSKWADGFVDEGGLIRTNIGLGVSTLFTAGMSAAGAFYVSAAIRDLKALGFRHSYWRYWADFGDFPTNGIKLPAHMTLDDIATNVSEFAAFKAKSGNLDGLIRLAKSTDIRTKGEMINQSKRALREYMDIGLSRNNNALKFNILRGIKWGFAIATIVLATIDIVITSIALYEYYNRDHLPIPKYMVDLSYNEDKEASYIVYKSVRDQNSECGDLNGGGGKQWLALYVTYDEDAGNPIIAPDQNNKIIVQTKTDKIKETGYDPLHLFGTPTSAQNLTQSGGKDGWSYNDGAGGIYLFFKRVQNYEASTSATSFSKGRLILLIGLGFVIGMIGGSVGERVIKRKIKKT